jgi:hypothetical protein
MVAMVTKVAMVSIVARSQGLKATCIGQRTGV